MQSLDVFLSRLRPLVPGCPEPTAVQALLDSAIEFCDETVAITTVTEPSALRAGAASYDLDLPPQTELTRVVRAWSGKRKLKLTQGVKVDTPLVYYNPAGEFTAPEGPPTIATITETGVVTLYPTPDAATAAKELLTVKLATRPTRTATQVDDALYSAWAEAIVAGAMYRLAGMPGTSFSDEVQSVKAHTRYRYFINRARVEANRTSLGGAVAVRSTPFA